MLVLGGNVVDDEWVIPMIQRKMDEGWVFWIVQRNPLREEQLRRVEDIGPNRHVIIRDRAARELFEQGRIGLADTNADTRRDDQGGRPRRTTSAREAARSDTVAHPPLAGG